MHQEALQYEYAPLSLMGINATLQVLWLHSQDDNAVLRITWNRDFISVSYILFILCIIFTCSCCLLFEDIQMIPPYSENDFCHKRVRLKLNQLQRGFEKMIWSHVVLTHFGKVCLSCLCHFLNYVFDSLKKVEQHFIQ